MLAEPHADDRTLGLQTPVLVGDREHQPVCGEVVRVRIGRIVAAIPRVGRDHRGLGVRLLEIGETRDLPGQVLQRLADVGAADGFQADLRPERVVLAIVEQHVGIVQQAADAELERPVPETPIDRAHRVTEGTVDHRDRHGPERVVDRFMPVEHLDRIGSGGPVNGHHHHSIVIREAGVVDRRGPGRGQGRDAVLGRPPREALVPRYGQSLCVELRERIGLGCVLRSRLSKRGLTRCCIPAPESHRHDLDRDGRPPVLANSRRCPHGVAP